MLLKIKQGMVARSGVPPPGMQMVAGSILSLPLIHIGQWKDVHYVLVGTG